MKKILITGGTGFVGQHLAALLRKAAPADALHLTTLSDSPPLPQTILHQLDLNESELVAELIKKIKPEQIYHLAALANVGASFIEPRATLANNFSLTLNLLEAVRRYTPQTRILLISSADLYAPTASGAFDETALLRPASPYGASKAMQDLLGQTYAQSFNLQVVIARPFNHIGPGQRQGFVVADFASKIAAAEVDPKKRTLRVGNLTAKRDFTDVRDMVKAYQMLMNSGKAGEIYNLGTGKVVTIEAVLAQLLALSRVKIKVISDKKLFRPVDLPQSAAIPAKIKALGWQPQIPLAKTLADTLNYWRDIIKA